MFVKKSILCILALLEVIVMIGKVLLVARVKEVFVAHEYRGLLNRKVGHPRRSAKQEKKSEHDYKRPGFKHNGNVGALRLIQR